MTDGEYDVAKSATETALRCARIAAAATVVQALVGIKGAGELEIAVYCGAMRLLGKEFHDADHIPS